MGDYYLPHNTGLLVNVSEHLAVLEAEIAARVFKTEEMKKVIEDSNNASREVNQLSQKNINKIQDQIDEGEENAAEIAEIFEDVVRQIIYRVLFETNVCEFPSDETEVTEAGVGVL
tara:strand:+ start:176 stop:523 length:348 start_codon:yes stop_codon:yes gene_type:complete